jgi:hypothetical protein
MANIPIIILRNKTRLKYKKEFERIFQLEFNKFFNLVTGFDICLFDEILNPPDGVSLKEFVANNFGNEGKDLILNLIK